MLEHYSQLGFQQGEGKCSETTFLSLSKKKPESFSQFKLHFITQQFSVRLG